MLALLLAALPVICATGKSPTACSSQGRQKLPAPLVDLHVSVASPTRGPWIVANGWRFLREPAEKYAYEVPGAAAPLAAAEAFAYGADAIIRIMDGVLQPADRMLAFLQGIPSKQLRAIEDFAVRDDGSASVGEILNLLSRRNLLFRIVHAPDPAFTLNVRPGSKEFPAELAANPSAFALEVRRRLGDDRRSLRIYGTEMLIAHLVGDGSSARLHLLNYGNNTVEGARILLRGRFKPDRAYIFGHPQAALQDFAAGDVTEFTIPEMRTYAVIDLVRASAGD